MGLIRSHHHHVYVVYWYTKHARAHSLFTPPPRLRRVLVHKTRQCSGVKTL